eukprot:15474188-Alexandrium_andersonii.AAC.1
MATLRKQLPKPKLLLNSNMTNGIFFSQGDSWEATRLPDPLSRLRSTRCQNAAGWQGQRSGICLCPPGARRILS